LKEGDRCRLCSEDEDDVHGLTVSKCSEKQEMERTAFELKWLMVNGEVAYKNKFYKCCRIEKVQETVYIELYVNGRTK
jgi:hypothetical protein